METEKKVTEMDHGLYSHFKGGKYVSLWVGKNSETSEPEVHYMNLTHGTFYNRPLTLFTANVARNGKVQRRFQLTKPLPLWRRLFLVLRYARL